MYANNIIAFAQIRLENIYILVCLDLAWIHDFFYLSIRMNRKYKIHRINFLYFYRNMLHIRGNIDDRLTLTNQKSLSLKLFWMTLSEPKDVYVYKWKQVDDYSPEQHDNITVYIYLSVSFFMLSKWYICMFQTLW